jgi:hypothetical protein
LITGQLVGLGLGAWYGHSADPMSGQVATSNQFAFWGALSYASFGYAFSMNTQSAAYWLPMAGVLNTGLVLGGVFAQEYPMSRSRVFFIDKGGAAGFGAGLLGGMMIDMFRNIDNIFFSESAPSFSYFSMRFPVGVAMVVGLASLVVAGQLSDDEDEVWSDDDEATFKLDVVPAEALYQDGRRRDGLGVTMTWTW